LLKGSSRKAKNPGFKTDHTCVQTTVSRLNELKKRKKKEKETVVGQ